MYIKKVIHIDEVKIHLTFNVKKEFFIIGGFSRHIETIRKLCKSYFKSDIPKVKFMSRNKIRFEFDLSYSRFEKAIKLLEDESFVIVNTKSHGRGLR